MKALKHFVFVEMHWFFWFSAGVLLTITEFMV